MTPDDKSGAAPRASFTFYVLLLGLCTAIGPFAIDMYLPGLAELADDLKISGGTAQYTLTAFFLSLAFGQLAYGPVSDVMGRRRPMLWGLGLFTLASFGCAFANSIETLIVCRFLQGLGGAAGGVLSRAVGRDLYSGERLTRLYSMTLMVLGASPILAPVLGSFVVTFAGWRAIFHIVGVIGLVGFVLTLVFLPETASKDGRDGKSFGSAFAAYGALMKDGWFLTATGTGGFALAAFFAYLSASSVVYISQFGFSPRLYGMFFGLNAFVFIVAAQFNVRLIRIFGITRLMTGAAIVMMAGFALMAALATMGQAGPVATIGLMLVATLGMSCLIPPSGVLVMEPHAENAGAASALMGAMQVACGFLSSVLVNLAFDGTVRPMAYVMALCAFCSVLCWATFLRIRAART